MRHHQQLDTSVLYWGIVVWYPINHRADESLSRNMVIHPVISQYQRYFCRFYSRNIPFWNLQKWLNEGGMGQSEWGRNGTIGVRVEWDNQSDGGMGQSEWGRNGTIGMRVEWGNRSEGGMKQSEWGRNGTIGVGAQWDNRSEGGMEQSEWGRNGTIGVYFCGIQSVLFTCKERGSIQTLTMVNGQVFRIIIWHPHHVERYPESATSGRSRQHYGLIPLELSSIQCLIFFLF